MEPASTSDSNGNEKGIALNKDGSNSNHIRYHFCHYLLEVATDLVVGRQGHIDPFLTQVVQHHHDGLGFDVQSGCVVDSFGQQSSGNLQK
jgi:hypothetical protein